MKKSLLVFVLLICFISKAQQIPQYSQWFWHQFALNPAHAGIKSVKILKPCLEPNGLD